MVLTRLLQVTEISNELVKIEGRIAVQEETFNVKLNRSRRPADALFAVAHSALVTIMCPTVCGIN